MKKLIFTLLIFGLAFLIYSWDRTSPVIKWGFKEGIVVGKQARLSVQVSDGERGLASWTLVVKQKAKTIQVLEEDFSAGEAPAQREAHINLADLASKMQLSDGEFRVHVTATDQASLHFFYNTTHSQRVLTLDSHPPSLELRSGHHYITQGGAQIILYSTINEEAHISGVSVGDRNFRGFPQNTGPNHYAALIGVDYKHTPGTPIRAWAEDLAGNRSELNVPCTIRTLRFRKRTLTVSDAFISKVSREILARSSQVSAAATPAETFIRINNHLRKINIEQIRRLTRDSASQLLFKGPFMQMVNTKVEAAFADERDYAYDGEVIDRQTHLGYDLASFAHSPVDCANDGEVIWAGYLGIYGNCVIVDHGLGLASLYGHMSSIETEAGAKVKKGQSLGRSGATGLASGVHLHFTTLVQGTPVNPLEWWDAKWVQQQVFDRLNSKDAD